jgi:hypothetical protein
MKRKQTNKRRWALWSVVMILLAVVSFFSAEVIGEHLGVFFSGDSSADPFDFGGVTQLKNISGPKGGAPQLLDRPSTGDSQPLSAEDLANNKDWKSRYSVGTERDTVDIQEAILADDEVDLRPGDYLINQPLRLRNGLVLRGRGARLIGTGEMKDKVLYFSGLDDIVISGVSFWNMNVAVAHSTNITLEDVTFAREYTSRNTSPQLSLDAVTQSARIRRCLFVRKEMAPGVGLSIERSENVQVSNSSFFGAHTTAIAATGACRELNNCNRGSAADPKYEERDQNRGVVVENSKFHRRGRNLGDGFGINIWGAQRVSIAKNHINGWPLQRLSGSIQVGNGEDLEILQNRCDSGVYIHHDQIHPRYLRNVRVHRNLIRISPESIPIGWQIKYQNWLAGSPRRLATEYAGIVVERSFDAELDSPALMENNISVLGNTLENGLIRVTGLRPAAISLVDNKAALCRWPTALNALRTNSCSFHAPQ